MPTLICDSGAYTLVGSPSFRALVLACAAGSYTLTGTTTPVVYGHPITALSGSYAITGSSIGTNRITAEPGSYQVQGTAATLTLGAPNKTLIVSNGSYTLTGTTVSLIHSVPSEKGVYALTGTDAFIHTGSSRILNVDVGSYTLTGTVSILQLEIPIDSGFYTLSGTVANLRRGQRVLANSGSYLIAPGPTVLLKHPKRLPVDAGVYTLSGTVAVLTASSGATKAIFANTTAFNLTGQPVTLRLVRTTLATSGSYTLTGITSTLRTNLSALSGSYTLTGTNATLSSTILMVATAGSYLVKGQELTVDTANKSNSGLIGAVLSKTWSHTVAFGLQRVLLVAVSHTGSQSNQSVSGVTFNGTGMTLMRNATVGGGGTFRFVSLWYMTNPPVTTANIVVTFANTIVNGIASAVGLTGANLSVAVVRTTNAASGTSITPSVTIAGGNLDNLVFDCLTHTDSTTTVGPGQTQLQNINFTSGIGASSYETAGASVVMSWTLATSGTWLMAAGEIVGDTTKLRLSTGITNPILSAVNGVYTLNGFALTPRASFRLPANAGSYTLTGQASLFPITRIILVDIGSYTLTGTSTPIGLRIVFPANSGSYVLTGTATTLTTVSTVTADGGSYTLLGSTATLFATSTPPSTFMTAGDGIYAISGVSSTPKATFRITLNTGQYLSTGSPVSLPTTRIFSNAGSYALVGSSVVFRSSRTNRWVTHSRRPALWSRQPSLPSTSFDPLPKSPGVHD